MVMAALALAAANASFAIEHQFHRGAFDFTHQSL